MGEFLFCSEFTYEEDPENPLGKKKRVKKCKQPIAPDTSKASTSRKRRRIDFLDDSKDENMVKMKRDKVVSLKERLKEYRVLNTFLKKENDILKA
jgi:hypothetical protein